MKVYSLTKTLDDYVDFYTDCKEEAEVLVVGGSKIELDEYPNLKYIFKCGVGVDNIPDLDGTGIELIMPSEETKKAIYDEVSSFTVYSILNAHYRNAGDMDSWTKVERNSLFDKKLLIVGYCGNIGSLVLDKTSKMFKSIEGYDVTIPIGKSLDNMIREADIVTLHIPLNESTKGMLDCSLLKDDVILVNTSRAGLVEETQLFEFLMDHPRATAVFDVFWKEPYSSNSDLLTLDNFIATPHIASSGDGFQKGLYRDLMKLLGD